MTDNGRVNRHLQAGRAAFERGDWGEAVAHARSAVALAPAHAGARNLLGLALLQAGQAETAVGELEAAAGLLRRDPALLGNLAQAYAAAQRHEEAHQAWRRAQRLAPQHWPFAMGAAIALARQGRFAEAETILLRLAARHPDEPAIHYNLGNLLNDLQRPQQAEHSFRAALALAPADADARLGLGVALHRQSRFEEAEALYRACIAARPEAVPPHLNLVSLLIDAGRFAEAETAAEKLASLAPDDPRAHRFLGAARGHQGKLLQAIPAYAAAVQLAPGDPLARRTLGGALAETGQLVRGLRELAAADALEPDSLAQRQLLSMVFLGNGMFSDGWTAYRDRPYFHLPENRNRPGITQTLPENLHGLELRVRREQGLGDELFFLRYVPLLKQRGARVIVQVSGPLASMVERTGIADQVLSEDAEAQPGVSMLYCGDLPHALFPQAALPLPHPVAPSAGLADPALRIGVHWPAPAPPLRIPALPEAQARMRESLDRCGHPPYLGVTWRAGTPSRDQTGVDWVLSKQLPVRLLGAALRAWPGTVVALQRLPAGGELAALAEACGRPVADFTAVNECLEDMLALLERLDDYAGVSNTNMHLRVAAGRTARVLVPVPAEWRWMQWGASSPWFPGFRVYRQSLDGDWTAALAGLARDLAAG